MIYQVRANILFNIEDEARDFYRDCQLALAKGSNINPDSDNIEISTIELILNRHDLNPNEPCSVILAADTAPS